MTEVPALKRLHPREELEYLYELYGEGNHAAIFEWLVGSFSVLQQRAQMLLGLVTICLTITGFSGPQIAASGTASKICIAYGLFLVLLSAVIVLLGPLQLRWGSQRKGANRGESLVALICIRNRRSRWYHLATVILILGLTGYVGSVIAYLFQM